MAQLRAHRRTAQGVASRERILDAAIQLIGERGYTATSVDLLCQRAGIVKTALYWHFGSKEGLLAEVLERVAETWIREIKNSTYQVRGNPPERLSRALDGVRTLVEQKPHLIQLLLSVALERTQMTPDVQQRIHAIFQHAEQAVVEGIEDTLGTHIPNLDLAAHTMLCMVHGAVLSQLVNPEHTNLDRLFLEIRKVLVLSVAQRFREAGIAPTS